MKRQDCRYTKWGWVEVRYRLSMWQELQILWAKIKVMLYGGCPAQYMSPELEDCLCGFDPDFHHIERFCDAEAPKLDRKS